MRNRYAQRGPKLTFASRLPTMIRYLPSAAAVNLYAGGSPLRLKNDVGCRISGSSSSVPSFAMSCLPSPLRTLRYVSIAEPMRSANSSIISTSPFLAVNEYQSRSYFLSMRPATSHGVTTASAMSILSLDASFSTITGRLVTKIGAAFELPMRYSKPSRRPITGSMRWRSASLPTSPVGGIVTATDSIGWPSITTPGTGLPPGKLRPYTVTWAGFPASTTGGNTASIHGLTPMLRR